MTRSILLIGGTGTISSSIVELLRKDKSFKVSVLNRGHKKFASDIEQIICDIKEKGSLEHVIGNRTFDAVIDFLIFDAEAAEERVRVFKGHTNQYFYISTVVTFDHENYVWLNEDSKQENCYSVYGQKKKNAEDVIHKAALNGFPAVIVRPSQTYSQDRIPLSVKGNTCWSVIDRIKHDKPVIIHGDGKSIWHMMHADDFAYNFVQMVGNKSTIGQSINLVNPEVVTWDMIYREISLLLGKELDVCHISSDTLGCAQKYNLRETILGDKQYSNLYETEQLYKMIPNFRCSIGLRQGLKKYFEYIDKHPECKLVDEAFDAWCDSLIRDYRNFAVQISEKY